MSDTGSAPYQEIEHTADLALRIRGDTLEELFANAAQGMFYLMSGKRPLAPCRERQPEIYHIIQLESLDTETLLVDWLNELLYLTDVHKEIYDCFEFTELSPTRLTAKVSGEKARNIKKAIKAATFHDLAIKHTDFGYTVNIVFDV